MFLKDLIVGLTPLFPEDTDHKKIEKIAQSIYNGIHAGVVNSTPGGFEFPARHELEHDFNILAECVHSMTCEIIRDDFQKHNPGEAK